MQNFNKSATALAVAGAVALALSVPGVASAEETTKLRIQTHFSTETLSGELAAEFVDDVQTMSNGGIEIEMFYSGAVVKATETFDAAATGILDCDMTGGAYQVGKNPAFQFAGDLNGGYSDPYTQYAITPLIWNLLAGGSPDRNHWYRPSQ